jgi:hypothetical protein
VHIACQPSASWDWGSNDNSDDASYIFEDGEDKDTMDSETGTDLDEEADRNKNTDSTEINDEGNSEINGQRQGRPVDEAMYDHSEQGGPVDTVMDDNGECIRFQRGGRLEEGMGWQAEGMVKTMFPESDQPLI